MQGQGPSVVLTQHSMVSFIALGLRGQCWLFKPELVLLSAKFAGINEQQCCDHVARCNVTDAYNRCVLLTSLYRCLSLDICLPVMSMADGKLPCGGDTVWLEANLELNQTQKVGVLVRCERG